MSGYNADVSQPAERDDEAVTGVAHRMIVAQLEREKGYEADRAKRYHGLLTSLADDVLSFAETLDYEIGDGLKATLMRMANLGIIDLPTKTVMLTGTYITSFEYGVKVEVPIFTDLDDISHDDYSDEIADSVENDTPTDWQIESGHTYED